MSPWRARSFAELRVDTLAKVHHGRNMQQFLLATWHLAKSRGRQYKSRFSADEVRCIQTRIRKMRNESDGVGKGRKNMKDIEKIGNAEKMEKTKIERKMGRA